MSRIPEYRERRVESGTNWPNAEPGEMVVCYRDNIPVMVEFRCPCGCDDPTVLHLNYPGGPETKSFPRWDYVPGPTLSPSIRRRSGCKSHFNIENGKTVWHADTGS